MKEAPPVAEVSLQTPEVEPAPPGAGEIVDAAALTPMMKQYLDVKGQHPGALLFFRLGDFYELFFEDAVKAAELLQITLTSRAKGLERVPMCGVPYHAARRHIAKLIELGERVAICEQLTPPGKGIVKREVVRVVTPGMVLDDDVLEARENNFLAALRPPDGEGDWGGALLDASTGEFVALTPGALAEVAEELARHGPKELLVPESARALKEGLLDHFDRRPSVAALPDDAFDPKRAAALLKRHLKVHALDGFGLSPTHPSTGAAGAALRYLTETQKSPAAHVDRLALVPRGAGLVIDEASLANLEVLRALKDGGRQGSLLGVVDRTCTPLGARRLARWLRQPLADVAAIDARLDAVEELVGAATLREGCVAKLRAVADIERLCGRLSLASGGPRDLGALGKSLAALPALAQALGQARAPLLRGLMAPLLAEDVGALAATLERALVDEPPPVVADGGFIRPGFHAGLDECVQLASGAKDYLAELEKREQKATGIGSLKVRYNRVFGYFLEVTKAKLKHVPAAWTRKQTTATGERYVTEELKTYEEKVLTADEQRHAIEVRLFDELRSQVASKASALRAAADAVAAVDALAAFARVAVDYGYARPVVDDGGVLEIEAGRHPVVERALDGASFVPNDVRLDRDGAQLLVITGPNMAGKSTVMRQVALTVLLAQAGSFVPAKRARLGLVDRLFTRVGASDNLARGQSTFMVEMTETANILHHATKRSLVVLDEIGRGTSTFDGLSIAWAVAEHLHDRVGARTLFATHYHELTDLVREKPKVRNACIAVKEQDGRVIFLRKLIDGAASRSYGIEVAKLAGLPPEVLARARELLQNLEATELDATGRPRLAKRAAAAAAKAAAQDRAQLALFTAPAPAATDERAQVSARVLAALEALSVDATTPLEALNAVADWKRALAAARSSGG